MPNLKNPDTGETISLSYDESGMTEADRLRGEGWVGQEVGGKTGLYRKKKTSKTAFYKMKGHTLPGIKQTSKR